PCRRCRTPVVSMRVAQRGTHFCPRCQPNPIDD
ncbi:MAG: DNA-formamidopyrimidine glycosylase, partial [Planctomycetota bacterium]